MRTLVSHKTAETSCISWCTPTGEGRGGFGRWVQREKKRRKMGVAG